MVTRNQPCPCGSGKRYKHCHGRPAPPPDAEARIDAAMQRIAGTVPAGKRPAIASWTEEGRRYVAVDKRVFCGPWTTFVEFLGHYIARVLGTSWGNTELAKAPAARHPLLTWYTEIRRQQTMRPGRRRVTAASTGAAAAYMRLAYDFYALEHYGDRLSGHDVRDRMIAALKRADRFVDARHAIRVAASLVRAGFALRWDDEANVGEFIATHPRTQRALRVTCAIRPHVAANPDTDGGRMIERIGAVLRAPSDLPRLICADVNASPRSGTDWRAWLVGELRRFEADPASAALPPAYVLITNAPDHYADARTPDDVALLEGFGIEGLRVGQAPPLARVPLLRRAHADVLDLLASMRAHADVPTRFEPDAAKHDALPNRPRIGAPYTAPDGRSGVVVSAVVTEPEPVAVLLLAYEDGRRRFSHVPLSEHEMATWRRYPETFFGDLRLPPPHCRDALDVYAHFEHAYRDATREQLLGWMARWPQPEDVRTKSDAALLEQWCSTMTERAMADVQAVAMPAAITELPAPPRRG